MWIQSNITGTNQFYVPIGDYVGLLICGIILAFGFFLFLFLALCESKRLDRYRLKFGFDKEIEIKDISGTTDEIQSKLDNKERRFKRRMFKD